MRTERVSEKDPLTLVGAGLVGSLLAAFLARRGFHSRLYERRPDMRKEPPDSAATAGRSINLAVSARGLYALRQLGLEQKVLDRAIPMKGRMMHAVDGTLSFQRYGRDDSECIHSVSRSELNQLLLSNAEATGKVEIIFERRAVGADLERAQVVFENTRSGEKQSVSSPAVIGTDGSASAIRAELLKLVHLECRQEYLSHGYKELVVPPGPGGSFLLEKNALHIWPRGTHMLIALPNLDGSFTCTLFLPMEGTLSFASLQSPGELKALFEEQFGDALPLIADLEKTFFGNPTGHMVTVKCEPWHYRDRALLLGDAAHAIVPFFGQGMNCGFEDCTVLDGLLAKGATLEEAFPALTAARKSNADAIADMAVENFVEMSDKVADPRFLLEKSVERVLQEKFPGEYVSRYALVTFTCEPYRLAYEMGTIQAGILKELCAGLGSAEQLDLARAEKLIRSRLSPLMKKK